MTNRAILMVLMEPPVYLEPQFHDWYDTELIRAHLRVPGILAGSRWICVDGWPRHMAFYELESLAALQHDAYRAISGTGFSPWSQWMLQRVAGRERLVLQQVDSAAAAIWPHSRGLALLRFGGHRSAAVSQVMERLRLTESCRGRVFETPAATDLTWDGSADETVVVIESPAAALIPKWSAEALADALGEQCEHLLGLWVYVRYIEAQKAPRAR